MSNTPNNINKDFVNESRSTTGMTKAEKLILVLVILVAVAVAVAVPVFIIMSLKTQLRFNRINIRDVRNEAITSIQTGLGDMDSTVPDQRKINEGLAEDAGWVAMAHVDKDNNMTDFKIFVVDDIADYENGIAPGKVSAPVSVGSDVTFYAETKGDWFASRFAAVRPTSGGAKVYTVHAVLDPREVEIK